MVGLWRDGRLGLRSLLRKPAFLAAVCLSLMIGIGANTAIFILLDQVFLHPLPGVERPDRLVAIYHNLKGTSGQYEGFRTLSYPNYLDLRGHLDTLQDVALFFWQPMSLSGGSDPERVVAMYVTSNYFPVLGLDPHHGRFFGPDDDAAPGRGEVLVLGHGCWRRMFGADPGVINRKVVLNGRPFTIIGIAPPGFKGTELAADAGVFIPVTMFPAMSPFGQYFDLRGAAVFRAFGRLAPDATLAQADEELMRRSKHLAVEFPADLEGLGGRVLPLVQANVRPEERPRFEGYGRTLMIAVGLVLLIACINVANLLMVRGAERGRELALRRAVGATRGRLVRQLLAENVGLFLLGGLLSLPVARWCLDLLWSFRPPQFPADAIDLGLDPIAIFFAFGVALAAGLIFGLVPALGASSPDLVSSLKETPGGVPRRGPLPAWLRLRHLLVVAQVALALVTLIAAGLFVRNLRSAQDIDLGFNADRLAVLTLSPGDQGYDETAGRELYRRVIERVETLPGVHGVGLSENRLLRGGVSQRQIFVEGRDAASEIGERSSHRTTIIAPGFFKAVGIILREGSDFAPDIPPDAPAQAIINETMARTLWPGEETVVGKRFHFDYPSEPLVEIVGVVADAKYREIQEPSQFFIYLPLDQGYPPTVTLHVRTDGDPADLLATLRQAVREIDPNLPLVDVAPLSDFVDEALWLQRTLARLFSVFGVLAMLLAVLGIYGVLSYRVNQRRRELGIRVALGAGRAALVRTVYAEAAALVGAGLLIGLALAWVGLGRLTAGQLEGVDPTDPLTYGVLTLALIAVAAFACWLPALRASRVDAVKVLRSE